MSTTDLPGQTEFELSAPSRNQVALAIGAYASSRATDGKEQLRMAGMRVASEARHRSATPEQMVLAVKHLFERAPRISGDVQKRVEAFDKFVSRCLEAYAAGGDAPSSASSGMAAELIHWLRHTLRVLSPDWRATQ